MMWVQVFLLSLEENSFTEACNWTTEVSKALQTWHREVRRQGTTVMGPHHADWTWYSLASMPHHPVCYQNCLAPVGHSSLMFTNMQLW